MVRRGTRGGDKRRSYSPSVDVLDPLRLLGGAGPVLPEVAIERGLLPDAGTIVGPAPGSLEATREVALRDARPADLRDPTGRVTDPEAITAGYAQLSRYLGRAWSRAGIPEARHDDCSQAVYLALLRDLGRDAFDALVGAIGNLGLRDVLNRESGRGPGFFRAVDTVKKRAQRERRFHPLDPGGGIGSPGRDDALGRRREALRDAIEESLSSREAGLIRATLEGKTPAEIAHEKGRSPKTISNEKCRLLRKLRELLAGDSGGGEAGEAPGPSTPGPGPRSPESFARSGRPYRGLEPVMR